MKDAVKNAFMKPGIYTMAFICLCFLLKFFRGRESRQTVSNH